MLPQIQIQQTNLTQPQNSPQKPPPSKLLLQLQKQSKTVPKTQIDQEYIDDLYQILTKIQSKNLMLIELLVFLIEKGFVKNQYKIWYFMELYNKFKIQHEDEPSTGTVNSTHSHANSHSGKDNSGNLAVPHSNSPIPNTSHTQSTQRSKQQQEQQQKFTKKKFIKVFKQISKKLYPCDPLAYQNIIYKIITNTPVITNNGQYQHQQEIRLKIDEGIKKILSRQTIQVLRKYQRELEIVYEVYLPENFNGKMGFTWQQIKYLQKKLPIIAVFRFLWQAQICPIYITPSHFFELVSKIIPPHSLLIGSGQKQGQFYSSQTISNYTKQSITQKKMKLVEGDIGVTYLQFQILLARISVQISTSKQKKDDYPKCLQNLLTLIKLSQTINNKGQTKNKPNKFQDQIKSYFEQVKKSSKNNLQVQQKRQTKKKIEQILEINNCIFENTVSCEGGVTNSYNFYNASLEQDSINQFKQATVSAGQLLTIKKSLEDQHLPQIPQHPNTQKQNDKTYNIQNKHVVIGEQLPKLPEKNKPIGPPKKNDKKDDLLNKYKPQVVQPAKLSSDYFKQIVKVPKKARVNNQFPIILMDVVYPNDIPNLYLNPKSEIYLQTTYIHLGERSYEKAFTNYIKARTLCENVKNQTAQFYFLILQAQIYEAAARDTMALYNYHKAKQLAQNMSNKDVMLRYIAYKGLACCLFHIQQYQYSLRCFLKAKQLRNNQIQLQSIENAVLENNIGCIYMIMNRNNQAMRHFALSNSIMDLKLGKFDQRSVVVQQNQGKNKKAFIQMAPAYKTMWKTYVEKPGVKPAVKAAKKK